MPYGTSYDHTMRPLPFSPSSITLQPRYPNEEYIGADQTWLEDHHTSPQGGQRHALEAFSWQQQSNLPQYFDNEIKKADRYSSALSLALHSANRPGIEAVSSFPQVVGPRMVSPVSSHDISTPTSSNARSPATDSEYFDTYATPQTHDDFLFANEGSYANPDFGSACAGRSQISLFAESTGYSCVNLSDVQAWSDSQDFDGSEDLFSSRETYPGVGQTEYSSIEVDIRSSKGSEAQVSYRRSLAPRPQLQVPKDMDYSRAEDRFESASDMDADIDEEGDIVENEASDTDYTPKASRTIKRRSNKSSKPLSSFSKGRARVTKSRPKNTKTQHICNTCKASFSSPTLLQNHIDDSHPRVFTCVFNFAGCPSTFQSKNEWKRHVSTQHLIFNTWVCNIDKCGKNHDLAMPGEKNAGGGQTTKGGTFNRKDLFTQHLRRMHVPSGNKRQDKQSGQKAKWEDKIKALQQSCKQVNRSPPKTLNCPVGGCEGVFGGSKCWDDHMEHVAKHLEDVSNSSGSPSVQHENDGLLVSWAMTEGIIELVGGVYKLIPIERYLESREQDAEGEDEY